MQNTTNESGAETRRDFIRKTATVTAAAAATGVVKTPVYGQSQAPSANVIGANDRINVGFVGVGGMGGHHVQLIKRLAGEYNVNPVAVCDVWSVRREQRGEHLGLSGSDLYKDHRQLVERKDVDCVFVATVDHWHAPVSIDAMNAGKHVYIQKPMTRYLDEAFDIYDTAKRTGKLVQVGSQGCSDVKYHKVAELIRDGRAGQLAWGQDTYMRNSRTGEWNYDIDPRCTPDTLDWKHWLGQTGWRDFNADHYFRWRKYYPYCSGLLGDLLPHRLHPLMIAAGTLEWPSRVVCLGTKKISTDRDCNDNTFVTAEFPSGLTLVTGSSMVNEQGWTPTMYGHEATIRFSGRTVELKPERPWADEIDSERYDNLQPGESHEEHQRNFFESIRANKQPNANIELAIRVQTMISMAEMSERFGEMMHFDPKTRKVTNGSGKEFNLTYGTEV